MNNSQEFLIEDKVTYTLQFNGKFYLVENVPVRVNEETGEQFFAPSTVECLRQLILSGKKPERIIESPVYNYSDSL